MENVAKGPFRMGLALTLLGLHLGALIGVVYCPPWQAGWAVMLWALLWYVLRSLGITIMHHRYWTHGSFKCHALVRWFWMIPATVAFEGPAWGPEDLEHGNYSIGWVENHRQHHAFTEKQGDPHTPKLFGFWWAHWKWLLYQTLLPRGYHPADTLKSDPVARWQYRLYLPIAIGLGFLLPLFVWGVPGLVWCGFVGVVAHLHSAWSVNSIGHTYGRRPRNQDGSVYTDNEARNNRPLALVTSGEGNHGNHHVKPTSAQLGEHWYDGDLGYLIIWLMKCMGLTWNVNKLRT